MFQRALYPPAALARVLGDCGALFFMLLLFLSLFLFFPAESFFWVVLFLCFVSAYLHCCTDDGERQNFPVCVAAENIYLARA